MRKEMFQFKRQLIEIDERSNVTQLLACYFKSDDQISWKRDPVTINLSIIEMLEPQSGQKQSQNKTDKERNLQTSNSKSSLTFSSSKLTESSLEKTKSTTDFKEPKSVCTLTFNQIAFLIRKRYDHRMHQLAELNNDQSRKLHYYAHQLTVLEALDHNIVKQKNSDDGSTIHYVKNSQNIFADFDQLAELKRQ